MQRWSFPSAVECSVMSVNHSSFGAAAVKSRYTMSSWTGGPGLRFRLRFLENTDQIRCSRHSSWTLGTRRTAWSFA